MSKSCRNIYKTSRVNAGFTQEQAAEILTVSVRSLADYETGKRIPSDEVVCAMVRTYDAKHLAYMHLKENTLVGRTYLPDVEFSDIAKSVLKLQKEISDMRKVNDSMIEIACDGIIDEHEEEEWKGIAKEIGDVAGAAMALMFLSNLA
ncbi:Helix-turn-helix domain-containing protein [Peptoclostridium litorale DSM 5388]|uniref:Putative prophage lambdaCh01, transcriptional regulator n=1 Tax=Peptoclostridium litorale DSM 5388 TaxID=1121324 RepID=A0A069RIG0_PEPLI|nr:helix-turn-helix transcriptional regulator [Peptoclostridium litorale]KDR95935.1 putative prophage lambdaCh01, transcriptional regulator [Peptoclostridium litorale DSM 5388]SIO09667.1 Helix-turn-helix domain-containing protein [Peptoclostridium litorale DSM 5388]